MSKNFLEQFKDISLDKEEKQQVKSDIVEHMQDNPVREEGGSRHIVQNQSGLVSIFKSLLTKYAMTGTIAAAAIVLLGGGTSFAASGSLPGDTLYPVKTGVNEQVVSALRVSSKSQAKWDIQRAERRLKETKKLASSEGKISSRARHAVKTNLEQHIKAVKESIKQLQDKGEDTDSLELASNLNTSLKSHGKILAELAGNEIQKKEKEKNPSNMMGIAADKTNSMNKENEKKQKDSSLGEIISTIQKESGDLEKIKSEIKDHMSAKAKGKAKAKGLDKRGSDETETSSESDESIGEQQEKIKEEKIRGNTSSRKNERGKKEKRDNEESEASIEKTSYDKKKSQTSESDNQGEPPKANSDKVQIEAEQETKSETDLNSNPAKAKMKAGSKTKANLGVN